MSGRGRGRGGRVATRGPGVPDEPVRRSGRLELLRLEREEELARQEELRRQEAEAQARLAEEALAFDEAILAADARLETQRLDEEFPLDNDEVAAFNNTRQEFEYSLSLVTADARLLATHVKLHVQAAGAVPHTNQIASYHSFLAHLTTVHQNLATLLSSEQHDEQLEAAAPADPSYASLLWKLSMIVSCVNNLLLPRSRAMAPTRTTLARMVDLYETAQATVLQVHHSLPTLSSLLSHEVIEIDDDGNDQQQEEESNDEGEEEESHDEEEEESHDEEEVGNGYVGGEDNNWEGVE